MTAGRAGLGRRVACFRSIARPRMTQQRLADRAGVALGTIRKIERGERAASPRMLETLADALGVDVPRLLGDATATCAVRDALPAISDAIAVYDIPTDGPVRPLSRLAGDVQQCTAWRLAAQYKRVAHAAPDLVPELARALHQADEADIEQVAALLVSAYRSVDATAYKYGARDLSARLIELMRWAAARCSDPLVAATVAYVRTEIFFAARAHRAGLAALETAIDRAPAPTGPATAAARGALHMRAAVIAARAGDATAARVHLAEAERLTEHAPEGLYGGTAFGPDSVRVHRVAVAVSLGGDHVGEALAAAHAWKPPTDMPAERRSGFYIELARAQLWAGRPGYAFESLTAARRIAPLHTREHPWVRHDVATLRRLRRGAAPALTAFAEWCHAV
ncbi:XRE family transcriptional regulator [Streptomyces sp. WAC05374]|uniref:helix-turn-helix domain-containing protein n=1 Tax=Streptomyces sp. WAC05374 TaxID=2487420 RepID=UPI000F890A85|nr:helix-turn-helix transcriptional regulator [Streptomyces sp. WAC05374]RST11330.1 XRE family transcriptional regulator [Streptomyces sp. WAC05374]TDF42578.1 XRE family transcriptional regulator [Streptomyces sp. WAC05374]TDF51142.1 XRE family transcriptional regulator [Streptomyces sp. WAC05374]TDF52449.1 XRE family transcriptional regulator [Streptomyces sp. WAC05374]